MQPPRRQWPGYIGAIIVFVLLAGVGTAYGVIAQIPTFGQGDGIGGGGQVIKVVGGLEKVAPGDPQTLMLIGSDKRSKKSADGSSRSGQLSDTIMLVHLDQNRPTTVMSIPRDTQVRVRQKDGTYDTEKINAAFAQGGAELTYSVVTDLLHIPISHIIVTNFNAFQEAVNRLGCLYEDIDRSYFNDNSQGENYSAINVKSGYQLLCGADTLSWVRFRHTDNDLVRGARQQAFLRSAKNQVAASRLLTDGSGTAIFKIFRHYTETDKLGRGDVLSLLKLIVNTAHQPIRSVPFIATDSKVNSNLLVTPQALAEMRTEFLKATVAKALPSRPKGAKVKKKKKVQQTGLAKNLVKVPSETTSPQLIKASFDLASGDLPVYYPSVRYAFGGYASLDPVRTYTIKAGRYSKRSYPAFRLTYSAGAGLLGQYYGLQGTTWKDAPILKQAHSTVRHDGRTLQVYSSAGRYQLVAWQTPKAVYWISNSVSLSLGNSQMLDMAASLTKVAG